MIFDEAAIQRSVETKMRELLVSTKVPELNPNTPIQRYYRSILEVHRTAFESLKSGSLHKAFVLFVRFCSLAVEQLPKHPQNASYKGEEKALVAELLQSSLSKAEEVKALIKQKFHNDARNELENMHTHLETPAASTQDTKLDAQDFLDASHTIKEKIGPEKSISLRIASDIVDTFMAAAAENTAKNIETCGVLCGKKMNSEFVVTHVILPPQEGTSDSCCAQDEMGLFNIQKEYDLLTLGWIHTHPSQTAFLSSVDLHTHYAYQSSMDLAVAIVVAPTDQVGIFTITAEGMKIIGECDSRGFHTHSETSKPLFVDARHVEYSNSHKIKLFDLR